MGRGSLGPALPDQRPELRPLQNLRREGPQRQYYLGSSGRWRRAQLRGHVKVRFSKPRNARLREFGHVSRGHDTATLRGFAGYRAGSEGLVPLAELSPRISAVSLRSSGKRGIVTGLDAAAWVAFETIRNFLES